MGEGQEVRLLSMDPQGRPWSQLCCFKFNTGITYNDPGCIASRSGTILRGTLRGLVDTVHGEQLAKVRRRELYSRLETHSITS